ncbi:MAG: SMC-Scp complex subunit ScpB [Chitinispirillaceae bacterium]|nr:SMC-Scp complex subunit ScpB [Chitinispirillaceae bacterium]
MSTDEQDDIAEIEVSTSEELPEPDSKEPPPDTLRILEALLFASEEIMPASRLKTILPDNPDARQIRKMVDKINEILQKERHPFEIVEIGGGYQFRTVSYYHPWVRQIFKEKAAKKLSIQSLECLAIIAYKQPLSKAEIEAIRGVVSDGAMKTLLEKRLITITGRSDKPGRPLQYGTTNDFLRYFGLNKIDDLPRLEEFEAIAREKISELSIDELQTESQTTVPDEEQGSSTEGVQHDNSSEKSEIVSQTQTGETAATVVTEENVVDKANSLADSVPSEEPEDASEILSETVDLSINSNGDIELENDNARAGKNNNDAASIKREVANSDEKAANSGTKRNKKKMVTYTDGFEIQDDISDEELTETTLQIRESSSDTSVIESKNMENGEPSESDDLYDQKTEIILKNDGNEQTQHDVTTDSSDNDEGDFEVTIPDKT